MSTLQPTVSLTEQQINDFHDHGFLVIDSITTPEEVEMLRGVYDRLFASQAGREDGNQLDLAGTDEDGVEAALPQILNPAQYAPEMKNTQAEANALQIARQLLGPDVVHSGAHAIFKPARHGAPTPWHQDEAYWNPDLDYRSLSVWIPLQPATPENGCMQFIPGSHRLEVLPHRSIGGDTRVHGLELDTKFDFSSAAVCPLPAGGATIHPGRTLHFTAPNHSDMPRRALILMFGAPATPRAQPRRFPWNEIKQTAREARAKSKAGS